MKPVEPIDGRKKQNEKGGSMIFFAGMDFFLAALNVYYGINGTGNTALNWAVAVFVFGFGIIQIALYIVKELRN